MIIVKKTKIAQKNNNKKFIFLNIYQIRTSKTLMKVKLYSNTSLASIIKEKIQNKDTITP